MSTCRPTRTCMHTVAKKEIGQGCKELMTHLRNGKYRDITGEPKAVKGDVTKLRRVPGLSEAAKKTLANVEARTRNIPGTHEVRKTMRHQTHANRVAYGAAIFLTFSPSERDTTLMVRLARARQTDPAILADHTGRFQGRETPELDVDYMRLSPEALAEDRVPRQRKDQNYRLRSFCVWLNSQLLQYYYIRLWKTICI